jgi:hypothetical protein
MNPLRLIGFLFFLVRESLASDPTGPRRRWLSPPPSSR